MRKYYRKYTMGTREDDPLALALAKRIGTNAIRNKEPCAVCYTNGVTWIKPIIPYSEGGQMTAANSFATCHHCGSQAKINTVDKFQYMKEYKKFFKIHYDPYFFKTSGKNKANNQRDFSFKRKRESIQIKTTNQLSKIPLLLL